MYHIYMEKKLILIVFTLVVQVCVNGYFYVKKVIFITSFTIFPYFCN